MWLKKSSTVEPRYVELGYLEQPTISNCFSPWLKSTPAISNFTTFQKEKTLVNISQEVQSRHLLTRCTESWQMYWRVHGNENKVNLTARAAANAEGDNICVNFRDQNITPEIGREPRYLEPQLSRNIFRYPWEFEIAGFYCIYFKICLESIPYIRELKHQDGNPRRQRQWNN